MGPSLRKQISSRTGGKVRLGFSGAGRLHLSQGPAEIEQGLCMPVTPAVSESLTQALHILVPHTSAEAVYRYSSFSSQHGGTSQDTSVYIKLLVFNTFTVPHTHHLHIYRCDFFFTPY
jgi:hypothetical protein